MPPVEFEPTISASERPQIYALDRVATETGVILTVLGKITMYEAFIMNFFNFSVGIIVL